MIPSIVAKQVRETVFDYLKTTFALSDAALEAALFDFLDGEEGLFKGPYVDVRLPFRKATPDERVPLAIRPEFVPYKHQLKAFQRLYSKGGHQPQHTLVTTGTGSGKTECFLYPILDHCWQHHGEPGIKAMILYPMNALASDQARRLAETLWNDERLRGQVSAGLFVGGKGSHGTADEDHLVDQRDVLRASPPDILLTNYKMLDFLLMRPEDRRLWADNESSTLRYLVLDELHTYDGAQGSDVACLIRRLKDRIQAAPGSVCCVGTSATIGSETKGETIRALTEFAKEVFGEEFFEDSVVTEDRYDADETLGDKVDLDQLAAPEDDAALDPELAEDAETWLKTQARLWLDLDEARFNPLVLGEHLARHGFLRRVLRVLGTGLKSFDELDQVLADRIPDWAERPVAQRLLLLNSFISLVSAARRVSGTGDDAREEPFLTVQVQIWARELRHLVRRIRGGDQAALFAWAPDVAGESGQQDGRWLPLVHCRDCGASGVGATQREGDPKLRDELSEIGRAWLRRSRDARAITFGHGSELGGFPEYLCPACLAVGPEPECVCTAGDPVARVPVQISDAASEQKPPKFLAQCLDCGSERSLSMLGSRAPSLLSVAISHLFLSEYNSDKKLLAFTDAVQDASHRAGFFGARTYRFNLRTAFQGMLEEASEDVPLLDMGRKLLPFWSPGLDGGEPKALSTLLPADLRELPEYKEFRDRAGAGSHGRLKDDLSDRLSWEAVMEYGLNSRVGRTLEATRCSTVRLDQQALGAAVEKLGLELSETLPFDDMPSDGVDAADLRHFLAGLLHRMRVKGGVDHPFLKTYVQRSGNWFLLTKRKQRLMSPFSSSSVLPRFLMNRLGDQGSREPVFESYRSSPDRFTWYRDWAERALGIPRKDSGINDLYAEAVRRLEESGLLVGHDLDGQGRAWGLASDRLAVTRRVGEVVCVACGGSVALPEDEVSQWSGRRCPRYRCLGTLESVADVSETYYSRIYRSGRLERIFSEEHTGLLPRKKREELEEAFKSASVPGSPNLFVCTPTLEMGIDIGDLSATVLCSVPPTTSSFLQRIGRAGRKTGNALCLTLANSRPHDLYFYAEPREMMAGQVLPPGCFLDAPEMLKRQLVAHAMDAWALQEETLTQIPARASLVLGEAGKLGFPGRFLDFYREHRADLTKGFLERFSDVISPANRVRIQEFGAGEAVPEAIEKAFEELRLEREEFRGIQRRALKRIQDIERNPEGVDDPDSEKQEAEETRRMVSRLVEELGKKYPLNVLTDAGVLPNYAFPEPGVTLNSVVGEETRDGKRRYDSYEYVRPASSAIRELAPFNTFYAEGRKVRIDEIDLGSKARPLVEQWRMCEACAHMVREVEGAEVASVCPRCSHEGWADSGQLRSLLHFRRARSLALRLESSTVDDSDDRNEEYYDTTDLIDVGPEHCNGARLIEDLPFGYELLHDLKLREVNFGLAEGGGALQVAGRPVSEVGFKVCSDCGKVQRSQETIRHPVHCRARRDPSKERRTSLFLYREIESEAIRILLPVAEMNLEQERASFKAALELGFRRRFRGDPGHLQIKHAQEPLLSGGRRNYLVVFDAVPGGTGYLSELWHEDNFLDILELALKAMLGCDCRNDPQKDGCYRCLYAYQSQRSLAVISRRAAIKRLQGILADRDKLKSVNTLSEVSLDSRLESELEEKFLAALEAHADDERDAAWSETVHGGEVRWLLKIGDRSWEIRPQVPLGPAQGVSIQCIPDFVIETLSREADVKPIAVFCDGLAYHVCPDDPTSRLADDVAKRQAIMHSGRYDVWSITWKDVVDFEGHKRGVRAPTIFTGLDGRRLGALFEKLGLRLDRTLGQRGSMQLLWRYLERPDRDQWHLLAHALTIGWLSAKPPLAVEDGDRLEAQLHDASGRFSEGETTVDPQAPVLSRFLADDWLGVIVRAAVMDITPERLGHVRVVIRLFDETAGRRDRDFEASWRSFLQALNLLQFRERVEYLTTSGLASGVSMAQGSPRGAQAAAEDPPDRPEWELDVSELLEDATGACRPIIAAVAEAGLPLPSLDAWVEDSDHGEEWEAELAWPEHKIAVLSEAQLEGRPHFEARHWTVLTHPVVIDDVIDRLGEAPSEGER